MSNSKGHHPVESRHRSSDGAEWRRIETEKRWKRMVLSRSSSETAEFLRQSTCPDTEIGQKRAIFKADMVGITSTRCRKYSWRRPHYHVVSQLKWVGIGKMHKITVTLSVTENLTVRERSSVPDKTSTVTKRLWLRKASAFPRSWCSHWESTVAEYWTVRRCHDQRVRDGRA